MNASDIRVHVVDHGPDYDAVVARAYTAWGVGAKAPTNHRFFAFASSGAGEKTKIEASGFGSTEEEALLNLEAEVTAPPPVKKARTRAGKPIVGKDTRKYHLARAVDPEQAFHSVCVVEGCGRVVVRLSGREARRSDWRHSKPTERF